MEIAMSRELLRNYKKHITLQIGKPNSKWLFVATPENWQRCLECRTYGAKDRYNTAIQRIKSGDEILIHQTENKTAGICRVVRKYLEENSKMWNGYEIYRHRIRS